MILVEPRMLMALPLFSKPQMKTLGFTTLHVGVLKELLDPSSGNVTASGESLVLMSPFRRSSRIGRPCRRTRAWASWRPSGPTCCPGAWQCRPRQGSRCWYLGRYGRWPLASSVGIRGRRECLGGGQCACSSRANFWLCRSFCRYDLVQVSKSGMYSSTKL